MAKKSTSKQGNHSLKDINEESKEVVAIESADKVVNELNALQGDGDNEEPDTPPKATPKKEDPTDEKEEADEPSDKEEESEEVELPPESEKDKKETASDNPHLELDKKPNAWKRFWRWFWHKKWLTIPLVLVIILGGLLAYPTTRYGITSWFWKESIVIHVVDDGNSRPVTEATVTIAGQTLKTDAKGNVNLAAVPVGMQMVTIQKKNYQILTSTIEVPLFARGKQYDSAFHATGRVSDIIITNRISGAAIKAALITISADDQARTDDSGKAQVVVPADKKEITATIKADGYLDAPVTIKQAEKNELQLVPTGKLYFLSKQRGVIDVVKTNLDGTAREAVVQGTGQEDDRETNLLASRDWRYLLLKAKRTAGKPASLFIYDTVKGTFDLVDQGNAEFTLVGWSGHNFYYYVYRNDKNASESGQQALKSVNGESHKLTTVDENQAVQLNPTVYYAQSFSNFYIVDSGMVYTRTWYHGGYSTPGIPDPTDKSTDVVQVGSNGAKKVLKAYPSQTISYIEAKLYEPQAIYFKITKPEANAKPQFAELEDGTFREGVDGDKFDATEYPTYVLSPEGAQSFWSESRDGKNTLLLGGKNAENKQEIATKSDFKAYGWFTETYILMQKGDSELYITTPGQLKAGVPPVKVSDYHKPSTKFTGYGYGYGGQ